MQDPASYHKHPFVLETFYREIASLTTNGDLSDPDVVLKPMIYSFRRQEDQLLKSALERLPTSSWSEIDFNLRGALEHPLGGYRPPTPPKESDN